MPSPGPSVPVPAREQARRLASSAQAPVQELDVPVEAVRIAVYGEAEPEVGSSGEVAFTAASGCVHLRGLCYPAIGGYQITFFRDGLEYPCTLGFPVLWNGGEVGFVTNSHCTAKEWYLEYSTLHQPYSYGPLGSEAVDPRGWSCEITFKCRYSDAIIARASSAVDVGYVARTTGLESLDVSSTTPRFEISGTSDVYRGERVHSMGRTTGWRTGTVTETCVSFKKTWEGRWHKVLCTDVADYNSSGGNSGGPVFLWGGSHAITLVGIHFARTEHMDHSFFSPISGIRRDLGSFEARAPGYRTSGGGGDGCMGGSGDTMIIEPC